ncbi:MAG: uncharacterized protein JWO41_808 [Candidatus Saccharibacteria bacterium]|nr:uncharacterized protein [Candidatus Saccharibacteria bacterium]
MTAQKNTIKINGQHYDTSTGDAIAVTVKKASGKAPAITPVTIKKPIMDVKRASPRHTAAHKPESGKTLMRQAVKKPAPVKSAVKSKSKPTHSTPIVINSSTPAVSPEKLKQAQAVPKSQLITHFATTSVVPVANHPHAVKPAHPPKPAAVIDIKPRPVAVAEPLPSADIFQNALRQANSHEQPKVTAKHKKQRSKGKRLGMRLATTSLSVLLLAGFVAYQNMSQINIHLAAKKAGFAASLPSYKPSGFSVGAFTYSPGVVNVKYHSNSDQRSYAVTEKTSNWDDQTLREQFVATKGGDSYEVVQTAGRTIYVYGQKNATWVADGVWYNVQTNGSLSSHQLIELAASI